ncbi:MAG TPA: ABC transporter substrate-binding protein, partial [Vicinamibacterales bacterium]|nr:ABC transporter substrate-binding protein [Vicinamibacterales bacterium]
MQTRYVVPVRLHPRRLGPVAALCLSTLLGGFASIGGCTRQPPPAPSSHTLRYGTAQTAETPNVLAAMLSAEPLLVLNWHGRAVPRLASKWQWLDDGRTLSVDLRPGVQFHDGTPVTATAVAAILRKNIPTDNSEGFRYLTSIETSSDELKLTFHL